jgi:hypothetical protein
MSKREDDVDMKNSSPDNPGGDLIDRAVASIRDAPLPQGPTPLVAQRTISALWAAEVEAERKRSRWVIRIAAAIVLAVCAVATTIVLFERRPNFAQRHADQRSQPFRAEDDGGSASDLHLTMGGDPQSIPTSEIMVTGHVYFEGAVPDKQAGDASSLPQNSTELDKPIDDGSLIVNEDGTLANVVISISGGLPANRQYEPPPPAVLDMRYSMFSPHVVGVMVGQSMVVRNDDRMSHNPIATDSMNAPYFNFALPGGAQRQLDPFSRAQTLHLSSDLYPWMHGLIKVFNHPFFDVTRGDGAYAIRELPPGTYRIAAWHETLGVQEKQITVRGGEPLVVDFTFQGK